MKVIEFKSIKKTMIDKETGKEIVFTDYVARFDEYLDIRFAKSDDVHKMKRWLKEHKGEEIQVKGTLKDLT